ncbi:MAG TPA: ABC transporter substrate-binding protein [Solirubrobacterales bacterium]|nr:ABC transporter substrate-binding protein [Solirubrobacterales bacterium]
MRTQDANPQRTAWLVIASLLAFMLLFAAGCGDDDDGGDGTSAALEKVGQPEDQLDLIAWAGYVEDGSTEPGVDWVTQFEKQSGCQVNVKVGNTSDEMVQLMRTGQYDGVSASGDATLRLIEGNDVNPVNTDLVANYADVFPGLKEQPYNSVDGQMYGIPHGRGANLLMYNTDTVKPSPGESWSVVFDPKQASKYSGKVTAYDSPIYIADAALYLKTHQPDLGIENPYELDQEQFDAAIQLLKEQRDNVGEYWSDYTKQIQSFANGDTVVGTTWPYQYLTLKGEGKDVEAVYPSKEGSTGWSDTWMISSDAKHPNCMYLWMNHIIDPKVNAEVAEWFGEAPANSKACQFTENKNHCDEYDAAGERYLDDLYYWTTPLTDCGDDRGEVCKDYADWVQGWTEVKG